MNNFEGAWRVTQQWNNNKKAYQFDMRISADGLITVNDGYTGVIDQLGSSNQISMAMANFDQQTIASYVGNAVGNAMGGEVRGASKTGSITNGVWSAMRVEYLEAPIQPHHIP